MQIPKTPIRFAIASSHRFKWLAFSTLFAILLAALLTRFEYYIIKVLTDTAVGLRSGETNISDLWLWALLFPATYFVGEWIWRASGFCGMRWITGMTAVIYESLFEHLTGHSSQYFSERFAGALTNKISNASKGAEELVASSIWQFLPLLIAFAGDVYLCSMSHHYLALLLAGWILLYMAVNLLFVLRLKKYAFKYAEVASELKGKIVDSASNIDTVQHAGEVEYEREYIGGFIWKQRRAHLTEWMFSEWVLATNGILLTLFMVSMLGLAAWLLEGNLISVGSLVLVITIVLGLEKNLFFIGQQMTRLAKSYGQIQEGLEELLHPHDITEPERPESFDSPRGEIVLDNISFGYGKLKVFENFSITIRPGEKVGLVGPSGAGKSTLVNLIMRQYDVTSGEIRVNGKNIQEVGLTDLRRSIGLVPQTTSLFHRTIADNIRYGRLAASDEDVIQAAKNAQADEFIQTLPNGYETFVGERGVKLSGGQRQRISVARAFLKNAPILILDEATSALDSESEHAIQQAFAELMEGKTVIAIAHRLSTLRAMDRLIVVENGQIKEDGTHQELLAQNGLYARLWNSQVEGFIQE